jgi:hypothetical protein
MYNYDSSPIVTDCVFAENEAEENGAGISNDYHSSLHFPKTELLSSQFH